MTRFYLLQRSSQTAMQYKTVYDTIKYHWDMSFPDAPDKFSIISAKFHDEELAKFMSSLFSLFFGTDEYLRLCAEITDVLPLMKQRNV